MDLLLSIPVLTYFLAPSPPSWSTTLNIMFFYMTWTTLILSHSPLKVHLVGVLAIRLVFWLLPSLLTLLFDVSLPSVAESIKHGGRAGLPPRNRRALTQFLGLALFNTALLVAVEGTCSYAHTVLLGRPEFVVSTTLPFPWQMAKHVALMFVARELLQYYIHRFVLHGRSPVADLHARFAHARPGAPFSLQVFADHPLPLLLHRFLPLYLPAVLLVRAHLLTYLLFVALCTLEETLSMSGYTIVPGIVMSGIGQRCAIHYATSGKANFSAYGVADWAHGTSRGRGVLQDLQAEAEKHQLQERAGEKVSEGAGMVQGGLDALRSKKGKKKSAKDA
ncbi:hypothetical protein PWT90_01192 [Aphanocladium album]|nr:hypothetical protein PWT90_01192 [Aphanocladium album]